MKKIIIFAGVLIAFIAVGFVGMRLYTKQFSPQDSASYSTEQVDINVKYSRPYKKDRDVFGDLVPFGQTWRTGANEATVFTTNVDLDIKGKILPAGSYSLFTVPGEDSWKVIFNNETGQWGINFSGEANKANEQDELQVEVASVKSSNVFEQFTISFEKMGEEIEMIMMWDQTLIVVPMTISN